MFPVNDSVDNEFNYTVMSVYFEVRNCTQCYAAAHVMCSSIHMSGKRSGDHCCWCLKGEERRRHLINTETKEGRLADQLRKFTVLFSVTECESNLLCQSCFLILRSCVAAEIASICVFRR